MGEDDIVELLWKSGQVVRSNEVHSESPLLRGSGSSGGEGNAPPPNLFIQEDEMASWLQHPPLPGGGGFYSDLLFSATLEPPPPLPTTTRAENFLNIARLRENLSIGAGQSSSATESCLTPVIGGVSRTGAGPVVRESTQLGSSATPSPRATESSLTPVIGGVSRTFIVPGRSRQEKAVATEPVAGTSTSGVCKVETEPIQLQPEKDTEMAHDRKRKEREETIDDIEETEDARDSTSRRSRAAEMHNISERRRREKINEKMKALQELIPRCNKSDKASMLEDAVEYMKSLQMQVQMMSMGGSMMPMMYPPNMQQLMPHMARGMMDMNRAPFMPFPSTYFPRQAHMGGLGPSYSIPRYPFPNLPSQQSYPVSNQPQFPGYMNPYSQFAGLHQMQQPPRLQNQTSQLSFSQEIGSKEPEDQEYQLNG